MAAHVDEDYEFDEDAIEAGEDAYFIPAPSAGTSSASTSNLEVKHATADEFF